jgi:putative ABC transport system substrate-binding protein
MKRREFVQAAGLGLAASAVAGPAVAQSAPGMASQADSERAQARGEEGRRRQQGPPKMIGFLGASTRQAWSGFVDAFEKQLELLGWRRGQDFILIEHYAQGKKPDYATHAGNLARNMDIIVTAGTEPLKALKDTATAKPIVVASAGFTGTVPDNFSGFLNGQVVHARDRFMKFSQYVGDANLKKMAIMANLSAENALAERTEVRRVAEAAVEPLDVDIPDGADVSVITAKMITDLAPPTVKSLYVCTDPLLTMHRIPINNVANGRRRDGQAAPLPTMYQFREHVEAGGLMSYGPNFTGLFRDAATLVGRYLNGRELPPIADADSSQFELVWNRTTAQLLGLHTGTGNIPPGFTGVIIG